MQKEISISVSPEVAWRQDLLLAYAAQEAKLPADAITGHAILRRSIDARRGKVRINLRLLLFAGEPVSDLLGPAPVYKNVEHAPEVLIIGAGPAGLFAALTLLEEGCKPIILERGKDVRGRRRDIAALMKDHIVDPDSNYCFGEGGAGTYSDGKLYTRSAKRGDIGAILKTMVRHGASPEILADAHPHIGTNKLPGVIQAIRQTILDHGGEVHFNTRITSLLLESGRIRGVTTASGGKIEAPRVILATGHSARDVFHMLVRQGVEVEAKPFAMGVRVEHPQALIDRIQYHCDNRGNYLPAASYSVVRQSGGRGVYSFCMCPGGIIAPCATAPEEVVTNGWSPSRRDQPTANSGVVVELRPEDFTAYEKEGPLSAMAFQASIERNAWIAGGRSQVVPAQRLADFVADKPSQNLPDSSYVPGITPGELASVLPPMVYKALQDGLKQFGYAMKGYMTNEAVVHAAESRTSSPVRIPRDPETLEHIRIAGLYPCGEGAGYAGGIISAAMDGVRCARKCKAVGSRR